MSRRATTNTVRISLTDETAGILEKHNLPKWIQEETENLSGSVYIKLTESVIKNIFTEKIRGPDDVAGEFFQTSEEDIPILHSANRRNVPQLKFL